MVGQLGPVWVRDTQSASPAGQVHRETYVAAPPAMVYAGFWLRLAAFVIDSFIMAFLFFLIATLYPNELMVMPEPSAHPAFVVPQIKGPGILVLFVVMWIYYAVFEASPWQATPGKRMVGIYVTDLRGRRLTFGRASLRYAGRKIADFTLFVGYILIFFTQKRQGLHDLLAGTLVLRRPRRS